MPSKSAFFDCLRKSRLLTGEQFAQAIATANGASPRAAARQLCEGGLLTRWQVQNLLAGKTRFFVGKYALIDGLGRGRTGIVYKARDEETGRMVALKLMSADVLGDKRAAARFQREVELVSALRHPNVIASLDAGNLRGRPFLVTEYVKGDNLLRWIRRVPELPIGWACECIRQAALGLQHIHETGLIHRDLKPANLIVEATSIHEVPRVKILDLGLGRLVAEDKLRARLTRDGHTVGTLEFMAPEQIQSGGEADIRSDIYALGCTLFQALTRRLPTRTTVCPTSFWQN